MATIRFGTGPGNDYAYGNGGNDHFVAGEGNDYYSAGSGVDTIDFFCGKPGAQRIACPRPRNRNG